MAHNLWNVMKELLALDMKVVANSENKESLQIKSFDHLLWLFTVIIQLCAFDLIIWREDYVSVLHVIPHNTSNV